MKKILKLIALALTAAVILCGCQDLNSGYSYSKGDISVGGRITEKMLAIKSRQNTFPLDAVTFDLFYGLYNAESGPGGDFYDNPEIICIYATSEYSSMPDFPEDITSIKDHYLLRMLSEEEAYTEEYSYRLHRYGIFVSYVEYTHHEPVTLPRELFAKDRGEIYIKLVHYVDRGEEGIHLYYLHDLSISYTQHEDNTITLDFD